MINHSHTVTFYNLAGDIVASVGITPNVSLAMRGESAIIREAAKLHNKNWYSAKVTQ